METIKAIIEVYESPLGIDLALLTARVTITLLMLTHGLPKVRKLRSLAPIHFPPAFGLSAKASMGVAAFIEIFFSLFILLGLGTRIAVIPLIVTMLVAAFYALRSEPFAKKELAIAYSVFYTILLLAGSGRFSLDYLLH